MRRKRFSRTKTLNNKTYLLVFSSVFKVFFIALLFMSCSTYNNAISENNMQIEDIPQEVYEYLYLVLDNNSDKNIISQYCKNPDYYHYKCNVEY